MGYIWAAAIAAFFFFLGMTVGSAIERRSYHIAEDKESLVYENSVYVRVIEGTTIEDYLTAAGKPPKGKK